MLAREFIRAVQPHVYTEKVNFAAIKTALVAREKMQKRRQQRMGTGPTRTDHRREDRSRRYPGY